MTGSGLEKRIARLEHYRRPKSGYVVRLSRPPTPDEQAQLARAKAEGRRHAIMPHRCATTADWLARYGTETLQ